MIAVGSLRPTRSGAQGLEGVRKRGHVIIPRVRGLHHLVYEVVLSIDEVLAGVCTDEHHDPQTLGHRATTGAASVEAPSNGRP
jgi:hypothetical protein